MSDSKPNPTRRTLIKGAVAAGSALGFPYVHAQEKITLRYLGTAVNQDKAIAEKFKADTGITIQYIPVTTDDVTKRAVTAPNSSAGSRNWASPSCTSLIRRKRRWRWLIKWS